MFAYGEETLNNFKIIFLFIFKVFVINPSCDKHK